MFKKLSLTNNTHPSDEYESNIDRSKLPKHVAIIMDGNGRWAKKRGLPRIAGHKEGMNTVKEIVKAASQLGVEILTLYAFSTENWKRPKLEVDYLMKLPMEFLDTFLPEVKKQNIRIRIMGNENQLPPETRYAVHKAIEETKDNTGLILNFALNYGSRNELLQATKHIAQDITAGKLSLDDINEATMSKYLMTSDLCDPELLIRTSGEIRLSNFMLWQLAYAEFIFIDVLWPDFSKKHFYEAIAEFQRRGRRFGGI